MIKLPKVSHEEWKARRKSSIGGSEIATVLGLNRFETPLQLWAKKTGRLSETDPNDYMEIGTHLEPVVAGMFQRREGKPVLYVGETFRHDEIEFATATPDYWLLDTENKPYGVLECKTTSFYNADAWENDEVPNHAHCQTIWQLGVTGYKDGFVACLAGADPNKFYRKEVKFDSSIWEQMVDVAAKFMAMVKSDTPPDAKGEDLKFISKIVEEKQEPIELQCEDLVQEWQELQDAMKLAKNASEMIQEKLDTVRAKIVQLMDGHRLALVGGFEITNKLTNRAGYFAKASSYDLFKVKPIKEIKNDGE